MKLKQAELELNARTQELADVMELLTATMEKKDWSAFDELTDRFMKKSDEVMAAQRAVAKAD